MKKTFFFYLAMFAILLFNGLIPSVQAKAPAHPLISRITIRGTDIFDFETAPNTNKFPYSMINLLHIQTKEYVIRRAILFKVGDPMDVFLMRETERNLRSLSFVRAARVTSFPQRDGTVVLVVHVNDAWTTEPQFNASGNNGVTKTSIGFKEKNLFGLGKSIDYFQTEDNGVRQNKIGYFDPQFLGSRWELNAKNIEASNGRENSVGLNRPFYATDVRWSAHGGYTNQEEDVGQFTDNVKVSEYRQTKESGEAYAGIKLGHNRDVVNHAGLRYFKTRVSAAPNRLTVPGQVLPEQEVRQTLFFDAETFRNKFVEMTRLEKMTRIEDINLGPKVILSPGYSPRDLTGDEPSTEFQGSFEKYTLVDEDNLLYSFFNYSSRNAFEKSENELFTVKMKYYYRKWPRQTLVVNNRIDWGQQLDPDSIIELGSDNGLRSYKNVAFRGSKSYVFNLEDRLFFIDDLWELLAVGGAVFYDTGYVWESGKAVALSEMRSDAGVGLRFGLTKSSNEAIIRVDVSYRMQRATGDEPGWVLSFGTDQAF